MNAITTGRPITPIEVGAIINVARRRRARTRKIGSCLVIQKPLEPEEPTSWVTDDSHSFVVSLADGRWRDRLTFDEMNVVSLVASVFNWSMRTARRWTAKQRLDERRRAVIRQLVQRVLARPDRARAAAAAQFLLEADGELLERPFISLKVLRRLEREFGWFGLGYGDRLDELLDRAPAGQSPAFYRHLDHAKQLALDVHGGQQESLAKLDAAIAEIETLIEMTTGAELAAPAMQISATSYRCVDPSSLPARQWIYGKQLLRGSLSLVVAPGATGKTALVAGTALALATGRDLLGKPVHGGAKRVWLWNLEDSALELSYLIEAARLHWRISEAEIGERLFVNSGLEGAGLCIAQEDGSGFRICTPVVDALVSELIEKRIDVLIIDPFVSCHAVSENNNGAIDAVAKSWAKVGVLANSAICIIHHTRKLGGGEVTAEVSRGAVALPNAARSVLALNRMSPEEAAQWGIDGDERRRYFRQYDDKNNRAPPAANSDWFRLASVFLGNGEAGEGDSIPVVLPWIPPDAFAGVTHDHLREVQAKLSRGAYRENPQSPDWVGIAVAEVLGLDVGEWRAWAGPATARVKALLKTWKANKALVVTMEKDAKGNDRPFIRAGDTLLDGHPYRES